MTLQRIAQLWRYPVKSVGGERVAAARVGAHGLEGDRRFGLLDEDTGLVLTARREPRLLFATASWRDGRVTIRDEDGRFLDDDASLSSWLGRPVRLIAAGDDGATYESPAGTEHETDWQRWQGPGQAMHDSAAARLSLLSTGTVGPWSPARFRANILLHGEGEDALVGATVQIGSASARVTGRLNRCVMVTRAQPGLAVDKDVLRTIHRRRNGQLAVGAVVLTGGRVAEGDTIVSRDAR